MENMYADVRMLRVNKRPLLTHECKWPPVMNLFVEQFTEHNFGLRLSHSTLIALKHCSLLFVKTYQIIEQYCQLPMSIEKRWGENNFSNFNVWSYKLTGLFAMVLRYSSSFCIPGPFLYSSSSVAVIKNVS